MLVEVFQQLDLLLVKSTNAGDDRTETIVKCERPFGSVDRRLCRENAGISSVVAQMVATDTPENGCERLISVAETDPELARLVSAWPTLSAVAKRMILAALDVGGADVGTAEPSAKSG